MFSARFPRHVQVLDGGKISTSDLIVLIVHCSLALSCFLAEMNQAMINKQEKGHTG